MTRTSERVYWDACVFISLLDGCKDRSSEEEQGLRDVVGGVESGKLLIVTTQLIHTEVLAGNMSDDAKHKFQSLFKRRCIQALPVDTRVSEKAGELREYYQRQKAIDGLPILDTMDAIHLATA